MKRTICSLLLVAVAAIPATAQQPTHSAAVHVSLIKMPYSGARNVPEISAGPDYLEGGGIAGKLSAMGATLAPTLEIRLTQDDEGEYGSWHRMGLANGHLAENVATNLLEGRMSVGLLANCTSLLGILGGLQNSGSEPLDVGIVFIDAHGDFNTPESTLSGMLGGMPVAVSAGMALHNLRRESGLVRPIPTEHIVMGAVRDLDPLERELVEASDIQMITTDDIRELSSNIRAQMERLSALTDIIYVHVDMDVLDPDEVAGHPLTVPDGPTSMELAAAITEMFKYEKVAAFGVASTPANENDPEGISRQAAYNLIEAAVRGVQLRGEG